MPAPIDEAAEAAEFAALVAELEAPEADEDEGDGAAPEGESSTDPDEDEETEDEDAETDDSGEDEDGDEEGDEDLDDEDEESLTAEELAAKKLFESGDIKGACKRLGIDPKIFKINARQFTAMRKGLADAAKLSREATAAKTTAEKLKTDAEQVYGPIVAGFRAYKDGNPMNLRAAIELMCEDSFENVVATVARAAKGLDPAQVEVIKLRKELADREAKAKEEQTKAAQEAAAKTEVARIGKAIKDTPLAKIDGAAKEIYDLVAASFDGTGYGLTVKQAYQQVKAKHARVAAAFGAKLTSGKPGKPGKPARQELPAINTPPPGKKLTAAEKAKAEADEFAAVLKEAKAATRASERRNRKGGR